MLQTKSQAGARNGALEPLLDDSIAIDEPASDGPCSDALFLRGWALAGGEPVIPTVTVGGRRARAALWPDQRPDVAMAIGGDEALPHGFRGYVDLSAEEPGKVELELIAGSASRRMEFARSPTGITVVIDHPAAGSATTGPVCLLGWAQTPDGRAAEVELAGPLTKSSALMGLIRPSVSPVSGSYACGFDLRGQLLEGTSEIVRVVVVVRDRDGRERCAVRELRRSRAHGPEATIERARRHDGIVSVEGYVRWDARAPAAAHAVLALDGIPADTRPAMRSRPDAVGAPGSIQRIASAAATARCGFLLEAPDPSPSQPLEVGVSVAAVDGRSVTASLISPPAPADPPGGDLVSVLRRVAAPGAVVVDWDGGLGDDGVQADVETVSPPLPTERLPYADASASIVVCGVPTPERLAEARRVATDAVVWTQGTAVETIATGAPDRPREGLVSILVAAHGQGDVLLRCLKSVIATAPARIPFELLVLDDATPDDGLGAVRAWAEPDDRLRWLTTEDNLGYLRAINHLAAQARGDLLVLLNSDTEPQAGWLEALVDLLDTRPEAGAVGAKLIYADGRLQEAGAVVFRDASAAQLGNGSWRAAEPAWDFVRPVDYCSGAAFATRAASFEDAGGYDERYAPAYYEDVDYCLWLRSRGMTVLYQPAAVVVHHEGSSMGRDVSAGLKRHQALNQPKLAAKWSDALSGHPARPPVVGAATHRPLLYDAMERART